MGLYLSLKVPKGFNPSIKKICFCFFSLLFAGVYSYRLAKFDIFYNVESALKVELKHDFTNDMLNRFDHEVY